MSGGRGGREGEGGGCLLGCEFGLAVTRRWSFTIISVRKLKDCAESSCTVARKVFENCVELDIFVFFSFYVLCIK